MWKVEHMKKLGETIDADFENFKVVLVKASKLKAAKITELTMMMNDYLDQEVPDGQIPVHVTPHIVSEKILKLYDKAGQWEAALADEVKRGGDLRSGADNLNDEHHRIWISIYRKYHNIPDDDDAEPTGESPASGAPLRTYQVLAPTAAEIADNDRGLLSGAREVREAAVERVAARKELFMRSPDTANAARQYKSPPTPQNSLDKVFQLFHGQMEKDSAVNEALADDLRSTAEERRFKMRAAERADLNLSIERWTALRQHSTDQEAQQYSALIQRAQEKRLETYLANGICL